MGESVSVELPQDAVLVGGDSCGSGCVVQEGQLSESFTRLVSLQESRLRVALKDLGARQRSGTNDVEAVAFISFFDDNIVLGGLKLLHGVDDNVLLLLVEGAKHESHI